MHDLDLFSSALGLEEPWKVVDVQFDVQRRRLDLRIDFAKGARFPCPECGAAGCKVHDTEEKTWRHLNFFQHEAYLTARVPRVICPEHAVKGCGSSEVTGEWRVTPRGWCGCGSGIRGRGDVLGRGGIASRRRSHRWL